MISVIAGVENHFNGPQAVCYMKVLAKTGPKDPYDPRKENVHRVSATKDAIAARVKYQVAHDPLISFKIASAVKDSLVSKELAMDFDPISLGLPLIQTLIMTGIPDTEANIYLVFQASGNGGFRWVDTDDNPITINDKKKGLYPGTYSVAERRNGVGGDPYALNLPIGYWFWSRWIVENELQKRR